MDLPLPKIDLTAAITHNVHEVSQREMHFFVNPKQRKRMDVFKWRAEYVSSFGRRHTSHVLQCRVTNL
ncbi:hypothetical protein AAVH_34360 [Aphelenchoides avenae]|nr:hypothetical protein AAVH_34360 [Aphelenchus avenae]